MKTLSFYIMAVLLVFSFSYADELKIIHMNDTHSNMEPISVSLVTDGQKTTVSVGGMARAAALIKTLKAKSPDSLLLHAGDAVQGTLYYTIFRGKPDAEALNLIGFDAMTLGNHEFDDGNGALKTFIGRLTFPVLSANAVPDRTSVLYGAYKPYIIKEINGKKYGIIGLTVAKKTRESSHPGPDITFLNEKDTAQKYINELAAQGIDRIILLSHCGYENEVEMAGELTGVDIIIGGDTHTLLGDHKGLISDGPYPTVTKNKDGDTVCITQAWSATRAVGELDAAFDGGKVTSCLGDLHILFADKYPAEDKNMATLIAKYSSQVNTLAKTPIGQAGELLANARMPGKIYDGQKMLRGSEIAPITAKAFYEFSKNADIAIQNAGGVRISIPEGDITVDTAYSLLPFGNTLFELKLYGSEIKQALEDVMQSIYQKNSAGAFPYAYGLKYDIDGTKPYGERFSNLEVKDRKTGVWSPIDSGKMYTVITNSFTAEGKDGYEEFARAQEKRGKGTDTYIDYAMAFADYVKAKTKSGEKIMRLPESEHPIKSFKLSSSYQGKL